MLQDIVKAFYYKFPPHQIRRRGMKSPKQAMRNMNITLGLEIDEEDPWVIKRVITNQYISSGSLNLSNAETFDHIFKYWPLDLANSVALGSVRMPMAMWNYTDDDHLNMYMGPNTYLQKGADDYNNYLLNWVEMASGPWVDPGDELGLYWDTQLDAFRVKLL